MAKTARILKDGRKMDYIATADVLNGDVVVMGGAIGITHGNVATGETCAMDYSGTIEIEGKAADVFTQGDLCYYDTVNKVALKENSGTDPLLGLVVAGKLGVSGVISVDIGVKV